LNWPPSGAGSGDRGDERREDVDDGDRVDAVSEDGELYQRWASGDHAAAEELVGRHFDQIARFFANKVADASDSEELVSKSFEIVQRKLGTFRGDSSFRTYLFGIAHNVLRDYVKVRGRRPDVDFEVTKMVDIGPSPSVVMAERKEQALLLQAMRSIPLNYQIVLELSFFEELTQAEIAGVLALPPGTVASRLRRGKDQLEKKIVELAETAAIRESTMTRMSDWARSIRKLLDIEDKSRRED
jgi:RNA polymerase sigma-70 factor (ECF subfamily)